MNIAKRLWILASEWEPWGSYAMRNSTHSIAKFKINGAWIYVLWELPRMRIGQFESFTAAKEAASTLIEVSE